MTTRFRLPLTLAAALVAAALTSHAQPWQILLPSPETAPANLGRDVLINPFTSSPAPGIFLATEKASQDGSVAHSIFRLTPTDSFSSRFTIEPVDGALNVAGRLAYNPGDGLYAAGATLTSSTIKGQTTSLQTWKVRRSSQLGQGNTNSWFEDDSFNLTTLVKGKTATRSSRAYGIATDEIGNVYVCGRASDGERYRWIVRRKSGATWSEVYNVRAADSYSIPYDVCFVPKVGNNLAAVFVAGLFNDRWTVLRSRDCGVSWQPVGPWPSDGSLANAYDVASDSNGNIYVVGARGRDGQNRGWVLRRSTDGGTTWDTLLDQPSATDSWVSRLTINSANNITLAGAIDNANGSPRWAVVRNSPDQSWSDSWAARTFPLGENASGQSKGRGMVTDANGNLFLTGDVVDWTDPADGTFYSGTRVGLLRLVRLVP